MKNIVAVKRQAENNLVTMTQTLTKEVQFMNSRMKQKLLYQIGLTDEPWQVKDDVILDRVYSQDQLNDDDILGQRQRANSFSKWDGPIATREKYNHISKVPTIEYIQPELHNILRTRARSAANKEPNYERIIKRQKKFKTLFDKRAYFAKKQKEADEDKVL